MNADEPASASVHFDVSDPEEFGVHLSSWATSTFDQLQRQLSEVLTVVLEGQRGQQSPGSPTVSTSLSCLCSWSKR